MADIYITEARKSDLDSLTTILPRSFHPVNTYQQVAQPDTPTIRKWWRQVFSDEIDSKACHPIVAISSKTDQDVGILTLRRFEPSEKGCGFWSMYPLTDDHNKDMCNAFISTMAEWRENLLRDRAHYHIELFGTDHEWKGKGIGSMMLKRACEIADDEGVDMFVQANAQGVSFYEKFGFQNKGELVMPGEDKYVETFMVRSIQKE
jgi:ribosomal protein S18 acetylase RimI-like enzyme